MSKIISMIAPGYTGNSSWSNTSLFNSYIQGMQSIGANTLCIQTSYYTTQWGSTNVTTGSGTLSDATITALIQTAKSLGMKVMLKPHLSMSNNATGGLWVPGAQYSFNSYVNGAVGTGVYGSGQKNFSATGSVLNLTAENVGDRIVTPSVGHTNEIPNSGYTDAYAQASTPNFTTVTSVTSATSGTMSANANASSSNALFMILHDADAATWFSNWQSTMQHLLSIGTAAGGVDYLNLSTEHEWCTRYYPSQWTNLIGTLRGQYPNTKYFVQSGDILVYQAEVPFLNECDFISGSFYPNVQPGAGQNSLLQMQTLFRTTVNLIMLAYSQAWRKPILIGELGARSVVDAGLNPSNYSGGVAQTVATDQATFVEAALSNVWTQAWFAGYCWWTWLDIGNTLSSTPEQTSYAPKAQAQAIMASMHGSNNSARISTNGNFRYRLIP